VIDDVNVTDDKCLLCR